MMNYHGQIAMFNEKSLSVMPMERSSTLKNSQNKTRRDQFVETKREVS